MNTLARPEPRLVPTPTPNPTGVRWAVLGLVAGLTLTLAGLHGLSRELPRQRVIEPLTERGRWQRAAIADGVQAVADRAERAALLVGDPAALRDGAAILGSLATALGDPEAVHDLQSRSLVLAQASLERSPGAARTHLLAGAALLDVDGDVARAAWHLARAAALDPHGVSLRRQLGVVCLARGWHAEAATHFRTALGIDAGAAHEVYEILTLFPTPLSPGDVTPQTIAAQSALGSWLEDEGDAGGARVAYTAALVLSDAGGPDATARVRRWTYAQLQGHNFRQRDWPIAVALATERLESGRYDEAPGEALVRHHRGEALGRLGRPDEALSDLALAVELDPERIAYADAQASALAALARHAEAAEIWERALTLPRRTEREMRWEVPMRVRRARSLLASQQPRPAVDELRRVLRKDPLHRDARRMLEELGL